MHLFERDRLTLPAAIQLTRDSLLTHAERYAFHERKEEELRQYLGKDVSIMRDREGGQVKTLTMRQFRERIEAGERISLYGGDGCACFSGEPE